VSWRGPGWLAALTWLAAGAAHAAPAACPAASNQAGEPLRALPVIAPADRAAGRTLSLQIEVERPAEPVMIGDLPVRGAPVFHLTPDASAVVIQPAADGRGAGSPLAPECLASADYAYGGAVWALRQGDELRMHLDSRLDFAPGEVSPPSGGGVSCRSANIHTHGLLVSPYKRTGPDGHTLYGDYVLDVAGPAGNGDACASGGGSAMHMHGTAVGGLDYADRLPGHAGQNSHRPGGLASGLYWYHPHPHGYAALLNGGATAGLLTVGELSDYACLKADGGGCGAAPPTRDLFLKDAEVAPEKGGWRLLYARDYDLEGACASQGAHGDTRAGQCSDWRGRRWLFTVNGQRDPVITASGGTEVWRIVNGSSNVTYRLAVTSTAAPSAPLPLQVISLEGAAPDPHGTTEPGHASAILLMPGGRAEVAVTPPPGGGSYALEQLGFASGGDVWPAVRLAEVRFASAAPGREVVLHGPASPPPLAPERFVTTGGTPSCAFAPDQVRHIYFVQRPTFVEDRRRAGLYGLLAAVERPGSPPVMFDASGAPVTLTAESWRDLLKSDPQAPAAMHNAFGSVCTYLGHTETWVLENDTDEDHNFHIHQGEFQLALDHAGDPAFFSEAPPHGVDPLLNASDAAVAASDGQGRSAEEAILYHDTIPVPRGVSLGGRGCDGSPMNAHCRPGRITVRIRFDRDEQLGTFIYHCHILQHEDNGMMALISVLCPPDDHACALRRDAIAAAGSGAAGDGH
jgi:FtsP/CotA-like multicopper oxidase with cupredoxin domain